MTLFLMLALISTDPTTAYDARGEDIIPSLFQGKWAPAIKDCTDEDQVSNLNISATRVEAYDFRVKLLKHAGLHRNSHSATQLIGLRLRDNLVSNRLNGPKSRLLEGSEQRSA